MKLIENKNNKLSFLIEDSNETLINSIRRSVLEIPILAIDEVELIKNDSALFDEIIAHRLGLVPLKNENLDLKEECSCKGKGCSKCSVSFKLEATGSGVVYSSQLKGKAEIIFDQIPITYLEKNQELKLNATATLGRGISHAKYTPGLVYFRPLVSLSFNKDCALCDSCVNSCPLNLLSCDGKKIIFNDAEKCDACESCIEACKKEGKDCIELKTSDKDFIFITESWGQISCKEIFTKAIEVLNKNLKNFSKKLGN
jgi:DNA-directed RNA polymerase subunit D